MTCYSVQPRDRIFVNSYGFLSFAKNMDKNALILLYTLPQMQVKLLQKVIQKAGGLLHNQIVDKVTDVSRTSSQNS